MAKKYTQQMYTSDLVDELDEEEWTPELSMYFVLGSWIKALEQRNYSHKYDKDHPGLTEVAEC